jgi:regulator of protease activity HflC (stomatin/prohibitin superfamily)
MNFAPTSIFSVILLASGTATPTATIYTSNNNVVIIIIIIIIIIILFMQGIYTYIPEPNYVLRE